MNYIYICVCVCVCVCVVFIRASCEKFASQKGKKNYYFFVLFLIVKEN